MAGLAQPVGLGDLVERERLRHRQREPARLDQLADVLERVHGSRGPRPAAEADAGRLRAGVVGDRDHALGAAGELDERGKGAAAGGVERGVDPVGRELAEPSAEPSPYVVGSAPSERRYSWLPGLAVPITRAPRATAICTAELPTAPAAPLITTVLPAPTPSRSSVRTAVSTATGSPAAPAKSRDGGIGA